MRTSGEVRRPDLRQRLSMRSATPPGGEGLPDRGVMARTFTYLFGLGTLIVALTMALPHDPDRSDLALWAVAAAAALTSLAFLIRFDRAPAWAFHLAPALGSVMIAVLAYFAGPEGTAAYAFFFLWVALSSSYFFALREAVFNALLATACFAVALAARGDVPLEALYLTMVGGTLVIGAIVMVGLRFQIESLITRLDLAARTDPLTRLANRREFIERFGYEIARSDRSGAPLGVIAVDLDAFKLVNDRLGHEAGDRALEHFAEILRSETRRIDTVARVGGEEFALLAPEAAAEGARTLAERIRRRVEVEFSGSEQPLTVSCGVASFPAHGATEQQLLRAADRAMYAAKDLGRNRVAVYGPERHGPVAPGSRRGDGGSSGSSTLRAAGPV